ncbi:MAG: tetratricopeptide repeat protein [Ignavibacteriales bacterium]
MKALFNKVKIYGTIVIVPVLLLLVLPGAAKAQSVRGLVNDGVELYNKQKYSDSEVNFKKGVEKVPNNFNAYFNLGDAQYKQERYDEALKTYQQALSKTTDKSLKAKTFHNIGNSLLKSQKLQESVDAYKKALRLNPNDQETKYNLSYALNLLKQKNDKKQDQKNNQQDKNKDNKNQNNKNDQNKQDQNKQNQNKDQQKNDQNQNQNQQAQQDNTRQQNKQNQQQDQQQDKNKMSREEAQRILNALKNNELDLQKKLRKHEGRPIKTDKDW